HRVRGTENTIESYEKWELIGSHTARRSFASNMYNSGRFTTVQIMSITGHASEKSFLGYIKMDRQASARSIASDMFFNQ
ncbi:MAG: recombinase, partial [Tannerellaceae bacterium]